MRRTLVFVSATLIMAAVTVPVFAQTAPKPAQGAGGVPNVASLTPFTAATSYMSLAGYLRYVSYDQTGQWLTRAEADRMVKQQKQ